MLAGRALGFQLGDEGVIGHGQAVRLALDAAQDVHDHGAGQVAGGKGDQAGDGVAVGRHRRGGLALQCSYILSIILAGLTLRDGLTLRQAFSPYKLSEFS